MLLVECEEQPHPAPQTDGSLSVISMHLRGSLNALDGIGGAVRRRAW